MNSANNEAGLSRRAIIHAAWAVPAVTVATASPAFGVVLSQKPVFSVTYSTVRSGSGGKDIVGTIRVTNVGDADTNAPTSVQVEIPTDDGVAPTLSSKSSDWTVSPLVGEASYVFTFTYSGTIAKTGGFKDLTFTLASKTNQNQGLSKATATSNNATTGTATAPIL